MSRIISCTPMPSIKQRKLLTTIEGLRWLDYSLPSQGFPIAPYLLLEESQGDFYLLQGNTSYASTSPVAFPDFMAACYGAMKPKSWTQEDI